MAWSDRLAWSGETPLNYPELRPVAALRFDGGDLGSGTWPDAVDPANTWTASPWAGTSHGVAPGPRGQRLGLNVVNPATEQGKLTLPYFDGLWPTSGKLLMGLWLSQNYTMAHNPLMSTRSGPGAPQAYLATTQAAAFRHQVYSASGTLIGDTLESHGWGSPTGWVWMGQLVDFEARTSQLAAVEAATGRKFIGPARSLSGAPNAACTADLVVFALPAASMWTGGLADEVFVAHPTAEFDFAAFVERVRLGTWAGGAAPDAAGKLTVTDDSVTAEAAYTLRTGAEPVSWAARPEPSDLDAVPYWSTDNGSTWSSGTLPETLTGLLRWEVPLNVGEEFTGLTLLPPAPYIAEIPDQTIPQQGSVTIDLHAAYTGEATWTVAAVGVTAQLVGESLTISTGWASGDIPVTVTIRDAWGRTASRTFTVTVLPLTWEPPTPPLYPRSPLIVWDENGPDAAIIDALSAVVVEEVNGEHTLEFSLPVKHRHAGALVNERVVELAGEPYRIRRTTTARKGRAPVVTVYGEAAFYDLAYAGQVAARDWLQVSAGSVIEYALRGTGWSIGAINVTTRRTYSTEESSPLELLRTVQKQHGGDLLFDNVRKTVSLVVRSGRDAGVAFVYGRDLTESKRVVDTTSLVTRIYARNADGVTIASVNGGKPYVEDFTFTSEVREAVYDFAAGTSPYTMLSMAQATLANRCKPSYSYEFTVADLSHRSGQEADRFDVGDLVTVVDDELGIREAQRIVRVEHDIMRPWASKVTLSAKLREIGGTSGTDAGALTTGSSYGAFDLVPYNLLRNGRFDNALAHWASSGVSVVEGDGTGDYAVRMQGEGTRWIEQTVNPDNRDVYSLSFRANAVSGGSVPPVRALVTVEYDDGTTDTIPVELA